MTVATSLSNLVRASGDPRVIQSGPSSLTSTDNIARALGWFSIGLGLTQLLRARRVTEALGMEGSEGLVRAFGIREIAHGIASLSVDRRVGLWSRVAGDALDAAALMTAMRRGNPQRANVALALAAVAGVTMLDVSTARRLGHQSRRDRGRTRYYGDRSGFPDGVAHAKAVARLPLQGQQPRHSAPVSAQDGIR